MSMETIKKMLWDRQFYYDQDKIKEETHLEDDLGFDSLDYVEFELGVEEEFGIDVPDEDYPLWSTVGDILKFIAKAKDIKMSDQHKGEIKC